MRRSYHHPATLADMSTQGLDIWCWCNGCYHHAVLATDTLLARLGSDQGVAGVDPSCRFHLPSISSAYAGTGLRRRSSIRLRIFWNKLLGTATSANWNVT